MTNLKETINVKKGTNRLYLAIAMIAILCVVALMPLLSHALETQEATEAQSDTAVVADEDSASKAGEADDATKAAKDATKDESAVADATDKTQPKEATTDTTQDEAEKLAPTNELQNVASPANSNDATEINTAMDLTDYPSTWTSYGITCDSTNKVITFNSVNIKFTSDVVEQQFDAYCIKFPAEATVKLVGTNTISTVSCTMDCNYCKSLPAMVKAAGALTITTDNAKAETTPSITFNNNATYTSTQQPYYNYYGNSSSLTVNACDVNFKNEYATTNSTVMGVYAESVSVTTSGKLSVAINPSNTTYSAPTVVGVYADCNIKESALDINVSCGATSDNGEGATCVSGTFTSKECGLTLTADGANHGAYGIYSIDETSKTEATYDITIDCDSTSEQDNYIKATSTGASAYGLDCISSVKISGQVEIDATAGDGCWSYGVYSYYAGGPKIKAAANYLNDSNSETYNYVDISYGTVTINANTGAATDEDDAYSYGILCRVLNVGYYGTLNVSAKGYTDSQTFGIYAYGTFNILDNGSVKVASSVLGVYANSLKFGKSESDSAGLLDVKTDKITSGTGVVDGWCPYTTVYVIDDIGAESGSILYLSGYNGYNDTVTKKSVNDSEGDPEFYYLESLNYYNTVTFDKSANSSYSMSYQARISTVPNAAVTAAPAAKTVYYSGQAQDIATAGTCTNGTMWYAVGETAPELGTHDWTTSIPTETAVGSYNLWYYVAGDTGYADVAVCEEPVVCTITLQSATVDTVPVAKELAYTAEAQAIATAGTCTGGTMNYMVSETKPAKTDTGWTATVPTEIYPGSYNLWYYVAADSTHTDVDVCSTPVVCTITLESATVDTVPVAKELTYTGEPQALASEGECTGGTMYYIVSETKPSLESNAEWSTSIPTATEVGTYNLWYYVEGDATHASVDVCDSPVVCTINAKAEPTPTPDNNSSASTSSSSEIAKTADAQDVFAIAAGFIMQLF